MEVQLVKFGGYTMLFSSIHKRKHSNKLSNYGGGIGGAGGVRTRDLLDAIEARSQLRYGPTECKCCYCFYNTLRLRASNKRRGGFMRAERVELR